MIAYDTETALIRPGRAAPELACVSFASGDSSTIVHWQDPKLYDLLATMLCSNMIIGHNLAFDNAVICAHFPDLLPLVFKAYEESRMTCTLLRQQLLDIASGEFRGYLGRDGSWRRHTYELDTVAKRYGLKGKEQDEWRLQYGQLRELPLDQWPEGAKHYPKVDAEQTLKTYQRQGTDEIPDEFEQARGFFALQLASVWGLKSDPVSADMLAANTLAEIESVKGELLKEGLVRKDGSRDTKAAQERGAKAWSALGLEPRRTPTGAIQLDEEACIAMEDPLMEKYAEYTTLGKVLSTDVPILKSGSKLPIHTRFKLLETTRIGSSGPNVQNIRRKVGIRECFSPRPGWVICDVDYPALELRTLAQVQYDWFGRSKLRDVLNSGVDPHTVVAAQILGLSVEEAQKLVDELVDEAVDARGAAKVANFGLPGGLGVETFVHFADKSYGVKLTLEQGAQVKRAWQETWPEMQQYFAYIKSQKDAESGMYMIKHVRSGIVRACSSFTKAANSPFQSLGASCAKRGMWYVTRECYNNPKSVIYGARIVNFIHDQILVELPAFAWSAQRLSDAAEFIAQRFSDGAKSYIPDVEIKCKPILTTTWSKKAKQVRDSKGLITVWSPECHPTIQ